MKLPRFSATTLPSTAVLSPQAAAAAAAAPAEFGVQAAAVVSEFAGKMDEAENRSKAREKDSDSNFLIEEFLSRPEWEQEEIDGRPTEEVMAEDFDKLRIEFDGYTADISSKSIAAETDRVIEDRLNEAALTIRAQADQLRIKRTISRNDLTIEKYQMAGNWSGVNDLINEAYADGVYSSAQRNEKKEQNKKVERLTPYMDKLGSNDFTRLDRFALDALKDKKLKPDERIDMWRALSSESDARESDFYTERSRRQKDNMVGLWRDFASLSVGDIEAADVSPEQKKAAIIMKLKPAAEGMASDPDIMNGLYSSISKVGVEQGYTVESVSDDISLDISTGKISAKDGLDLQQKLYSVETTRYKGVDFANMRRRGEMDILQGVAIEDFWEASFYDKEIKGRLSRLANDWNRSITEQKIGPESGSFDPRQYYSDNIQNYRDEAQKIINDVTKETPEVLYQRYKSDARRNDGDFDITAYQSEIMANPDLSDEGKIKAIQRAKEEFGL